MLLMDRYGWPLEKIKGHPIVNVIRAIVLSSIRLTWKEWRHPQWEKAEGGGYRQKKQPYTINGCRTVGRRDVGNYTGRYCDVTTITKESK